MMNEYNSKTLIAESFSDHALSFAFNDDSFLQQFQDSDIQLFQDLEVSLNINKLKAGIKKGFHALSNIDWDNINKDINESLAKIEKCKLEMILAEKQKMALIKNLEKSKEKNIQRQLQLHLQHSSEDIMPWNEKLIHGDSLIYENVRFSKMDKDRIFFSEIQDNYSHTPPPLQRKRLITVPRPVLDYQFNPDEISSYHYYMSKKKKIR